MNEQEIFSAALECEPEKRAAFLDEACGEDDQLRGQVEDLLRLYEPAAGLFEKPAAEIVANSANATELRLSDTIGPYKLLEKIGEGGMGEVYIAEQSIPVRRKVALKIVKPGMDTKQVVARFEAERQALAMMNHPNIAKVLDAGATDSGRPYFVMELVKGIPVNEYCNRHRLDLNQRLKLFITICQAVQHAHQKGVIHRDLKPTNILVELHDVRAVPKVIDFGVAKATNQQLTQRTLHTGLNQMIGTPTYMSPEQAQLSGLDVDTRSDIYSLGILLYELLTGTTPLQSDTLQKADFDEMRRMIREDEPPRPSERMTTLAAEGLSTIADQQKSETRKLAHRLKSELDWIVMKALDKDRARRYESTSAFAADVGRFLANESVVACPPSAAYRFRKFARRNKAVLSTLLLVGFALVLGICGTTWQAVKATQSEEKAEAERIRAEANLNLAIGALEQAFMRGKLIDIKDLDPTRRKQLAIALEFYESFAKQNVNAASIHWEAGKALHRVGQIYSELDEQKKALEHYGQALQVFDQLASQQPDEPIWKQNQVVLHESIGWRQNYDGNMKEAYEHHRKAVQLSTELVAKDPKNVQFQAALARTRKSLAYRTSHVPNAEAIELINQALGFYDRELSRSPSEIEAAVKNWDARALSFYEGEAVARDEYRVASSSCYVCLGHRRKMRKEYDEAETSYRRSVQLLRELVDESPTSISLRGRYFSTYIFLADFLHAIDRTDHAVDVYLEFAQNIDELSKKHPSIVAWPRYQASAYEKIAQMRHARQQFELGLEAIRESVKTFSGLPSAWNLWNELALDYYRDRNWEGAEVEAQLAVEVAADFPSRMLSIVPLFLLSGKNREYSDVCQQMIERWEQWEGNVLADAAVICSLAPDLQDPDGLLRLANRAVADGPDWSTGVLTRCLIRVGQFDEAIQRLKTHDHEPRKYFELAIAYHLSDRHNDARQALSEAMRLFEDWQPKHANPRMEGEVLRAEAMRLVRH